MTTINDSNYELWLVRYADQELTADEAAAVQAYLATHPEAAEELSLFGATPRLEADTTIHAECREQLRHKTIPLLAKPALRWTAAAAVLAAILVTMLLPKPAAENHQQVAKAGTPAWVEVGNTNETVGRSHPCHQDSQYNRQSPSTRNDMNSLTNPDDRPLALQETSLPQEEAVPVPPREDSPTLLAAKEDNEQPADPTYIDVDCVQPPL